MKSITIEAKERNAVGTTANRKIRRMGDVPCVLYGGEKPIHFSAPERAFKKVVYTADHYDVILKIEGKEYRSILKDIQFHPVDEHILHIDFVELRDDKPVTLQIPVRTIGQAIGTKDGGVLIVNLRSLKVTGLPKYIPEHIDIHVEELTIGHAIHVSDIKLEGLKIGNPPTATIVAVNRPTIEIVATPAVAAVPAEGEAAAVPGAEGAAPAAAATPAEGEKEEKKEKKEGAREEKKEKKEKK